MEADQAALRLQLQPLFAGAQAMMDAFTMMAQMAQAAGISPTDPKTK